MVFTEKFSQFPAGTLDVAVGLKTGANTQGPSGGSGPNNPITPVIPQPSPPVTVGQWVRVNSGGVYTGAQADDAQDGEVLGIVIAATPTTFTLQQVGYITTAQGVVSGLSTGVVYFLDANSTGAMVPADALVNGQISRPVFVADSPTSGFVIPYRGLIVGGAAPNSPGGGGNDSNIHTINQNNTFVPGDVLYITTPSSGGAVTYSLAQANTFASSQAVGIVVANPAPTATQFTIQFAGYNTGSVSVDYMGASVVASTVYYLSPTTPGKLTSTNPTSAGTFSKPIYVTEQATANLGVNAGYILPQRPLDESANGAINPIIPGTFTKGTWVYISADGTYAAAKANNFGTSQAVGVVTYTTGGNSYIQTTGYLSGVVTVDDMGVPLSSATVYYLSPTVAGALTSTNPVTSGTYSKPLYIQQSASGNVGIILPQRPLDLSGASGGSGWTLISTQTISSPQATVPIIGITGFYRYMIVLENVVPDATAAGGTSCDMAMQVSSNNGVSYDNAVGNSRWWSNSQVTSGPSSVTDSGIIVTTGGSGAGNGLFNTANWGGVSGFIETIDPAQTNFYKVFSIKTNQMYFGGGAGTFFGGNSGGGAHLAASLINAVQFYMCYPAANAPRGNIASGTFKLYGTNV